jgi:transposase-like protein
MSSAKLSETDKQAILERYQQTDDTASALAEQFGVSASTVGRILKTGLGEATYQELSRRKRGLSRSGSSPAPAAMPVPMVEPQAEPLELPREQEAAPSPVEAVESPSDTAPGSESGDRRRRSRRRRSSAASRNAAAEAEAQPEVMEPVTDTEAAPPERPTRPVLRQPAAPVTTAEIGEESEESEEEDLELPAASIADGDEFGGDDFEDFGEEESDSGEAGGDGVNPLAEAGIQAIETRPLEAGTLPRSCYIVIDRMAELVTCSLDAFKALGVESAPSALPVFDSPRSARRFCNKNQRVIKVPDSQVLLKTRRWLVAKGIDRLLLDGNFYALN